MLCDFGLAKTMENMPTGLTTSTFNKAGSLPYESPELLKDASPRSLESDVWAWGCLLQEILSGKPPYYGALNSMTIVKWIIRDIPPAVVTNIDCPSRVRKLLVRCWRSNPVSRPSMSHCAGILLSDATDDGLDLPSSDDGVDIEMIRVVRSRLEFDETTSLGSGALGRSYPGMMTDSGGGPSTRVRIKRLSPAPDELMTAVLDAVRSWISLSHDVVVPIMAFCTDRTPDEILIVNAYVPGSNLASYLEERSPSYNERIKLALGVSDGLIYLHTRDPPIKHGRLHPGNILVDDKGDVHVGDYGLEPVIKAAKGTVYTDVSFRYQSPEVLLGTNSNDIRSDICQCVDQKSHQIVTGRIPYDGIGDHGVLTEKMDRRVLPALMDKIDCPARVRNLLDLCWRWEPESRPSINKVHGILSGEGFMFREERRVQMEGLCSLKFSYDGKTLAAGFGSSVILYDTETWNELQTLTHPSLIKQNDNEYKTHRMQFSRSGRYLASGSWEFKVIVWNLEDGKLKAVLSGHTDTIWGLDISSDDVFVASGGRDRTLRFRDLHQTVHEPGLLSLPGHVYTTAFTVGTPVLAVGIERHGVWLVEVPTGSIITKVDTVSNVLLRFSATGCWLFTDSWGGDLTCWSTADLVSDKIKMEQGVEVKG
ncbi:hypothetical protein FRB99_002739 [Tulasnella sp. 403]|nr:hypothetical protein FRB99_002739 [Tulasnella sp. 403]